MEQNDIRPHVAALIRAVAIVGSQQLLAAKIREFGAANDLPSLGKVSQQTISFWIREAVFLDAKYWAAIEAATEVATDGPVTRRDLRPDVFPSEHAA